MAKWGNADIAQMKALQEKIQKLSESEISIFCESCSKELAARLLSLVIPRTPVGQYPNESGKKGGTLRRGWTAARNGIKVVKAGSNYTVQVINPVFYASYVEYGHRQQVGRYVPEIGKRLKNGWINGQYFLTYSEQELERIAPNVLQKKLEKFLTGVFNGSTE